MSVFVCCADLGTSFIKVALIDEQGRLGVPHKEAAPPFDTSDGGCRFDAVGYVRCLLSTIRRTVDSTPSAKVVRLVLTGQRATVVPVIGSEVAQAVSWQDVRGEQALTRFIEAVGNDRFVELTGLVPSVLWTLAKCLWMREVEPTRFEKLTCLSLLNDYALRQLGVGDFVTDTSNASLTGFFDITKLEWSQELLAPAGLAAEQLPRLVSPGATVGAVSDETASATGLLAGTPLVMGGGDQQCAALGAGVCDPGDVALSTGTAAVVSCPADRPTIDQAGRWFCTKHVVPERWVLEGIHNAYGSSIKWACDLLGLADPSELEALAETHTDSAGGAMFLPFLAGIGSPDFEASATGLFAGLRLSTTRAEIARATMEGVSLEARRILTAMSSLKSTGRLRLVGCTAGRLSNQTLADVLGRTVDFVELPEAGLLGAAMLAWVNAGRFDSVQEAAALWSKQATMTLEPKSSAMDSVKRYQQYCALVGTLYARESG